MTIKVIKSVIFWNLIYESYVLIQKEKSGFLRMKERTLLKQLQRKNEKALEEIMKKYGAYVTTISK